MPLEVRSLQVAAQQIACAELAHPKVGHGLWLLQRSEPANLFALHLQLSAPLRHTYTSATRSRRTKTITSTRTNTEWASFMITPTG